MEKIRPQIKNETYQEYCRAVKEKLDEIVEFLGLLPIEPPPEDMTDPDVYLGRRDEEEPDGD